MPSDFTRPEPPPAVGRVPARVGTLARRLGVGVLVYLYPGGRKGGSDALWMFTVAGAEVGSWSPRSRRARILATRVRCANGSDAVRAVAAAVNRQRVNAAGRAA